MPSVANKGIQKSYLVPGLPHLVCKDLYEKSPAWKALQEGYQRAGEQARAVKPDVLVLYSAQWISVLGHSFQANPHPKGYHVDENWYDLADFPFDFTVDVALTQKAEAAARKKGLATKLVNYEGFPVDTGTLVAMQYFNPENKIPVVIVSSNIYCNHQDSVTLGQAVGEALQETGQKAVVITCSGLSNRFTTEDIDPAKDQLASPTHDTWNQKVLDLMKAGKNQAVLDLLPEYCEAAGPEMMFKGFAWMMGVMGTPSVPADVLAYGPLWGTGAAVVEYSLNN